MNHRRWLVRRQPARKQALGATRRDVLTWTVRPYYWVQPAAADEQPVRVWMGPAVELGTLTAAVNYARGVCALHYYPRGRHTRPAAETPTRTSRNEFERALAERR
ncbi:hypothetical protein [Microbacterium arborescens]